MENMTVFILGIAILSAGTYLMRLGGAKLGNRLALSERSQALLSDAATVLLFSVALATTFYEGEHFAGMARVLGVAFAVFLAWRKMPLIVERIARSHMALSNFFVLRFCTSLPICLYHFFYPLRHYVTPPLFEVEYFHFSYVLYNDIFSSQPREGQTTQQKFSGNRPKF